MKKRVLAILLAFVLIAAAVPAWATPVSAAEGDEASKYVTLDGDWHFKLYRTYPNMYQYFPYTGVTVTWEDNELALLPDAEIFTQWETFRMPADDPETGGLLGTTRPLAEGQEEAEALFPSWSEAWACRVFELPADFTADEQVTLLMGIIDDNDVIYINGKAVASSGFVDGNGAVLLDVSETGGFDYAAEDPAAQIKWEKSYWEIQREYKIPADVLNLGGTNEICVRVYNNNGFGGFYSGNNFAICGSDAAVRALKGLPTEAAESEEVMAAVAAQTEALAAGDIDAYAATVAEDYHNDADVKADYIADVQALLDAYTDISVTDDGAAVYVDGYGSFWYSASRIITGVDAEGAEITISAGAVEICFAVADGAALERGNWSRCYSTAYASELFGQDLTYSVYLPPSYYDDPDAVYPTVWLLHGRASSSTSYLDVDGIGDFMDEHIASGELTEMVVIMPDSGKYAFYTDSELVEGDIDNSGPWRTQLATELRAEVAENYRVYGDARFNGLSGNSMGAFGAMVVGTSYPELYSSVASHMGHLPEEALASLQSLSAEQLDDYDFYLDCGLQDATVGTAGTIAVHDYLVSVDKEHGYSLRDGGHNSAFYMSGMLASMTMHSEHFLENMKVAEAIAGFEDVELDAVYADEIAWALENKVTAGTGDTTFEPGTALNRAMFVRFLHNLEGNPVVNYAMDFEDVPEGEWYTEAVRWAASEKVVYGYGDGFFGTEDGITREQLAVLFYSYAKSRGIDVSSGESVDLSAYEDEADASGYARAALQWALAERLITGVSGGALDPQGGVTRADAVMMIQNLSELIAG